MSILLKALIALVVGVIVAYIVGRICLHFNLDQFWGWLAGVIAGVAYFVNGPVVRTPPQV